MPRLMVAAEKIAVNFEFEGAVSIGRHVSNALPLPDEEVSRRHAQILARDGRFYVTDLNSRNGVFVNGEKVQERELGPGDEIAIGMTLIFFEPPEGGECEGLLSPRGQTIWKELPEAKTFRSTRKTTYSPAYLAEALERWLQRRDAVAAIPYKLRSDFLEFALTLDTENSRGALASQTLEFLRQRIGAGRMAAMAVDARKKNLEILVREIDEETNDASEDFEIGRDVVRVALDGESAVYCSSCAKDYRFQHLVKAAGDYPLGAFLAVPYYLGRRYGGFVYLDAPTGGPRYDYKALLQAHLAAALMSKALYWLDIGRHGKHDRDA